MSLSRLSKALNAAGMALGSASCLLLLVLTLFQVVHRFLGMPFYYSSEYSSFLMVFIVLLPLGAVTASASHLAVDFLLQVMRPGWATFIRRRLIPILVAVFAAVLLVLAANRTWDSWLFNQRSNGPFGTLLVYPQLGMVAGLLIMLIAAVILLFPKRED